MLSIEECRKNLGKDAEEMTYERIKELRDSLHAICEQILDEYLKNEN